jgi:hypothetical protein
MPPDDNAPMIVSDTRRRAILTGDEQDVHTGWRHLLVCFQRAGKAKRVKQRTNKRERREGRDEIRRGVA